MNRDPRLKINLGKRCIILANDCLSLLLNWGTLAQCSKLQIVIVRTHIYNSLLVFVFRRSTAPSSNKFDLVLHASCKSRNIHNIIVTHILVHKYQRYDNTHCIQTWCTTKEMQQNKHRLINFGRQIIFSRNCYPKTMDCPGRRMALLTGGVWQLAPPACMTGLLRKFLLWAKHKTDLWLWGAQLFMSAVEKLAADYVTMRHGRCPRKWPISGLWWLHPETPPGTVLLLRPQSPTLVGPIHELCEKIATLHWNLDVRTAG